MYCRHLLLSNMVPTATQRLLGLATASSASAIQGLPTAWSSKCPATGSTPVMASAQTTPSRRHTHQGSTPLHALPLQKSPQHISRSVLTGNYAVLPSFQYQFSHSLNFHQLRKSSGKDGRRRKGRSARHPLLGSPCSLTGSCSARGFSALPKAILDASPQSFQPYLRLIRLDKPIGTMLLFWPCSWSIALAAAPGHLPDPWILALFGAGSFFMRGAGCVINDMWDSDFDKKVERTKLRPLASGELSHFQALVFLASQLSISLTILLQLNTYSVLLGAASMVLVVLYPLAKRYTYWPQIMLGFTFNYGALLGWSAVRGSCEWSVCAPLYLTCLMWTLVYDTVYAHQDKYDDMLIGVKSTALKLGEHTKPWLAAFSSVMIGGLGLTGVMCHQTWPYYLGVTGMAAHLAHQLYTVDLSNADDCAAKFRSNSKLGFFLFLCIVGGTLLRTPQPDGKDPPPESAGDDEPVKN